jgi:hypothetical protein
VEVLLVMSRLSWEKPVAKAGGAHEEPSTDSAPGWKSEEDRRGERFLIETRRKTAKDE